MAKLLVTGAQGFIGRHLLPELRLSGHQVMAIGSTDGDVAEKSTWQRLPSADTVIHLAARSFVPDSWNDPTGFIRVNFLGTCAALEYCRRHRAGLVYLSSYLYGAPTRLPISEVAPLVATNPYALSKKLSEEACRFYADQFGVDVTVLRPFNIYGAGQAEHFLIPSILRQLHEHQVIRVKDLAPRRDYVYIRDVVDAIVESSMEWRGYRVFNIGSGTSHSVEELIECIQKLWSTQLPVISSDERRQGEIMDTIADISRARLELHWVPRFALTEGLADLRAAVAR